MHMACFLKPPIKLSGKKTSLKSVLDKNRKVLSCFFLRDVKYDFTMLHCGFLKTVKLTVLTSYLRQISAK